MRVEALLAILLCATAARAQEPPRPEAQPPPAPGSAPASALANAAAPAPEPAPELPGGAVVHARKQPVEHLKLLDGHLISGDAVSADDVVDEMVDELAADLAKLGAAQVSPILLERVRVSDNMNPQYARILEARLAAALFRAANVALVRCAECWTTRSRIEQSSYVIARGLASRADVQKVAAHYGARTLLEVTLTLHDQPTSLAMDVELVRAEDSSIAFAEYYRLDPAQAVLYRGADTAQHREARLQMLQDRLDARPRYSHAVDLGAMMIPSDNNGSVWGGLGRYQLTEKFGSEEQFDAGLSLAGFLNTSTFTGGILGAVWQVRVSDGGVWSPEWTVGANGGAFLTAGGSSAIFGGRLRARFGTRISMEAGVNYLVPFQLKGKIGDYGGFSPELAVGFVWR